MVSCTTSGLLALLSKWSGNRSSQAGGLETVESRNAAGELLEAMLRPLVEQTFELPIFVDENAEMRWPQPWKGSNLCWYQVLPGL